MLHRSTVCQRSEERVDKINKDRSSGSGAAPPPRPTKVADTSVRKLSTDLKDFEKAGEGSRRGRETKPAHLTPGPGRARANPRADSRRPEINMNTEEIKLISNKAAAVDTVTKLETDRASRDLTQYVLASWSQRRLL